MRLLSTLALATVLSLSAVSFSADAGSMGRQLEHSARLLLSDKGQKLLELSDTQQSQLATIYADFKAAKKALKEKGKDVRKSHREEMKALMDAEVFDKVQAQLLLEKGQDKKQAWALLAMETRHKVFHVLNETQREKIKTLKSHRKHKRANKAE
ncbi:Spy/CpxP family protein refolding chaperone [Pseudoalteromonas peptidolytica]|uniref:Periplasmic heavy metal sensor n=1 Tax=Pseudoalteromonas peptidolytica F12-50-A1 TaxID=1315280 RepID=A0A8I0MU38_9GAMM|nr:Spy/CpxP family protein refolding chaperone [Pseudoalteromonas peptidolytica]MBE0345387.1 hypothetical protein [Pseudoalteromonas peptidolytica F12-50-A1]NLR15932.1 hypothetical protein [Pseudoalteromonas peptidolytica]GEK11549.1 hypothetical protein PPE03_37980 [Pseudoalteromonas peptidolytica]